MDGCCPRCSAEKKKWVQRPVDNIGVTIDVCSECKGVWLDSGEMEAITAFPNKIIEEVKVVYDEMGEILSGVESID